MATNLEKDITRESSIVVDERNILVTLTKDQKVSMKLKGMGAASAVSMGLDELYGYITGEPVGIPTKNKGVVSIDTSKAKAGSKNNPMVSLHDLRSHNAISGLDYETVAKFDTIIKNLIDSHK